MLICCVLHRRIIRYGFRCITIAVKMAPELDVVAFTELQQVHARAGGARAHIIAVIGCELRRRGGKNLAARIILIHGNVTIRREASCFRDKDGFVKKPGVTRRRRDKVWLALDICAKANTAEKLLVASAHKQAALRSENETSDFWRQATTGERSTSLLV